ncbi:MAG: SurA N-terminal domain-containing protein [Bacteroidaceae bacterium]|nr:SurA N-terminal domain-containing protein [Bacteroidaceae bacterium]
MATLQKLRNMGPLLVIFVGLALFAFIAGDAWRLFQSDSMEATVGTIDDEKLSAMDFEELYKECENAQRMFRMVDPRLSEEQRNASFTEDELAYIKEEAWYVLTQLKIAERQAEELGITVTNEEIMDILNNNSSNYLNSNYHPFRTENGFSTDDLNAVIASYNQMMKEGSQYDQNLAALYSCWKYMEKRVKLEALTNKQVKLIENATIANPVLANKNFNLNDNTYNLEVVSFPYTSVADSLVNISDKEIENYYKENKDYLYKQMQDTRDIKYISVKVTPSESDKSELLSQMNEHAESLKSGNKEYERIVRTAGSEFEYNDLLWTADSYPEDIQIRLEQAAVNEVVGPYLNPSDNSYNIFMTTEKCSAPDSLLIRAIVVTSQSGDEVAATTDSLINVLKGKADFKEVAKNYAHIDSMWITSSRFYTAGLIDNADTQKEIYNARPGVYATSDFKSIPGKLIYQVIEKKGKAEVCNLVVIKKEIDFSSDTYDKAYNKLSQFIASCKNIEDIESNAMANGYRVQKLNDVNASTRNINNIPQTYNVVKWALSEERNAGDFSAIEECGSNYLLFATVTSVNPKGYVALDKEINNYGTKLRDIIKNRLMLDKKAEIIMSELNGKDFNAIKNNNKAEVTRVNNVEFKKTTTIPSTNVDEPVIGVVAANMQVSEVSAPIKGDNGVYVISVAGKNAKNGIFNAEKENEYILSNGGMYEYANIVNQLYQMGLSEVYPVENKLFRFF